MEEGFQKSFLLNPFLSTLLITSRPWSLNTYCLPKLWYRTACLGDSAAITSSVKSWLFQYVLEKPHEMVTYSEVGLGVHNVKIKAMAMLILCGQYGNSWTSMLFANSSGPR